ncbi:cyclic nucleotide-binding domain-containing protein, partial [bacterium]
MVASSASPALTEQMLATMLFAGLPAAEVERIAAAGHTRRIALGEYFFLQGDPAERIYLLVAGRLKLTQAAADGQQALMRVVAPGTLFGALALAGVEAYPVSAQAAEDSQA